MNTALYLIILAEQCLQSLEKNQNYPVLLLKIIEKDSFDMTIRISSSVVFKNYIKRNWKIVSSTFIAFAMYFVPTVFIRVR